jgi:tRNA threonylcarbamoyl adenosine modification protein (Sua5/YciO/YrdC/YwlC family)
MKILIIQTAFLGDVILTTSFIADVADKYPRAEIHVLVRKGVESILSGNPHISQIHTRDKKASTLSELLRLNKLVRKIRFDQVYNLHRFAFAGFLTWYSGAKLKAGYSASPFAFSFTHKVKHEIPAASKNGFLHEVQRMRLLLDPTIKKEIRRPQLFPDQELKLKVKSFTKNNSYVLIAPSSLWFTKRWPESKWNKLIELIPDWLSVYLVGGKEDIELCERLAADKCNVKNYAGKLTLLESTALMEKAIRVFVNDSSPLHMASSVNAPTTAIFCSTKPDFGFTPLSQDRRIIKADVACCTPGLHGASFCSAGDFKCAMSISAEQVAGPELEIWKAAQVIRNGDVLLHDTDTIPGLGVRATDRVAVDRVYQIKARDRNRPLLVLCADLEMVSRYVDHIPDEAKAVFALAHEVPVTVVLPGAKGLAPNLLPENGTVGIRIPAHPDVRKLVSYVGEPLASTSANLSGNPIPLDLNGVDPLVRESTSHSWSLNSKSGRFESSTVLLWNGSGFDLVRKGPDIGKLEKWLS